MSRRTRGFWIAGLAVALLVAGVASWYASASPDGLERAAGEAGFLDTAEESATAGSPFADYAVSSVGDGPLSGGLAGVIGVLVTLALVGGLVLLLRRRSGTGDAHRDHSDAQRDHSDADARAGR